MVVRDAEAIGAGHSFIVFLKDAFPINVMGAVKRVSQIRQIFCGTANPVQSPLPGGDTQQADLAGGALAVRVRAQLRSCPATASAIHTLREVADYVGPLYSKDSLMAEGVHERMRS